MIKSKNNQEGSIAVLTALLLPVLIAIIALAIDIGYIVLNRQRMQIAADSASLVAAGSIVHGQDSLAAKQLAIAATSANGFTNLQDSIVIDVQIPPGGSGSYAQDERYVRVTVNQEIPVFLAWIFGVTNTATTSTSVAGPAGNSMPCMVTLESKVSSSLDISGSAFVNAQNCGIYINSQSSTALTLTGNANLTANPIQVVGNFSVGSSSTISAVTTNSSITTDPFKAITLPPFSSCTYTNYSYKGSKDIVISPGTYCGGITISGNHTVTLTDGVYVLYGGGLNVGGGVTSFSGKNITFYNSGNLTTYPYGKFQLTGSSLLNLSAPLVGSFTGMLFMQDPLNTLQANIKGNSGSTLAGNFYLPQANLSLTGSSGTVIPIGAVVAKSVSVEGNNQFSLTNIYGAGTQSGISRSALYE